MKGYANLAYPAIVFCRLLRLEGQKFFGVPNDDLDSFASFVKRWQEQIGWCPERRTGRPIAQVFVGDKGAFRGAGTHRFLVFTTGEVSLFGESVSPEERDEVFALTRGLGLRIFPNDFGSGDERPFYVHVPAPLPARSSASA